jgi:hypothetical protein
MFTLDNFFRKFGLIGWLPGFIIIALFMTEPVSAQTPIYSPDGPLGHIAVRLHGCYTSESAEPGVSVSDIGRIGADLIFPYLKTLTIGGSYELEKGDSLFHNISIMIKKYTANPLGPSVRCNPDGRIGAPIIKINGAIRVADADPGNSINRLGFELSIPLSSGFTLGAGANFYSEDKPEHSDDFYGIISFYPARYRDGKEYANPDGIEGVPSFSFRAGGSKFGQFGRLDVTVPLKSSLSVGVYVIGEQFDYQQVKNASLGARINLYSAD